MPFAVSFALTVLTHCTHEDELDALETRSPAMSTKSTGCGSSAPGVPPATIPSGPLAKRAQSVELVGCESLICAKVKSGGAAAAGPATRPRKARRVRARTRMQ